MSELSDLIEEAKRVGITRDQLARIKTKHRLRQAIEWAKVIKIFQDSQKSKA